MLPQAGGRFRTLFARSSKIVYSSAIILLILYVLYIISTPLKKQMLRGLDRQKYPTGGVLIPSHPFHPNSVEAVKKLRIPEVARTRNFVTKTPTTSTTSTPVPVTKTSDRTVIPPTTSTSTPVPVTKATDRPVIHKNLTVADFISGFNSTLNTNQTEVLAGNPHQICKCGKYKPPVREGFQKNLTAYRSTCSHEATEYGTGQKVRSYALFIHENEDLPRYVLPIEANMKDHAELFPGWITRIYSNISVTNPIVCGLICKYDTLFWCDITHIPGIGNLGDMHGRTWRFLPIGDPTVDIFLSRDMDNTLFARERAAVAEWEASDIPFHSMRDNPGMHVEMLAGMWGAKNFMLGPLFSKFLQTTLIREAVKNQFQENWDEEIIKKHIHQPYSSLLFLVHDSYYCKRFKEFKTLPFPTQRFEDQTVGEHYIKNVTKWTYPVPPCPVQCRPEYGKDWEFC